MKEGIWLDKEFEEDLGFEAFEPKKPHFVTGPTLAYEAVETALIKDLPEIQYSEPDGFVLK